MPVTKVHPDTLRLDMSLKGKETDLKMVGPSVTDTYNLAAAVALLSEFGLTDLELQRSIEKLEIVKSRYQEIDIGGKHVILSVAKGQNPGGLLPRL